MNAPRLDIERTRSKLVALGCTYAAEHLDHMLAQSVSREIAPHLFLNELLESELSGR